MNFMSLFFFFLPNFQLHMPLAIVRPFYIPSSWISLKLKQKYLAGNKKQGSSEQSLCHWVMFDPGDGAMPSFCTSLELPPRAFGLSAHQIQIHLTSWALVVPPDWLKENQEDIKERNSWIENVSLPATYLTPLLD